MDLSAPYNCKSRSNLTADYKGCTVLKTSFAGNRWKQQLVAHGKLKYVSINDWSALDGQSSVSHWLGGKHAQLIVSRDNKVDLQTGCLLFVTIYERIKYVCSSNFFWNNFHKFGVKYTKRVLVPLVHFFIMVVCMRVTRPLTHWGCWHVWIEPSKAWMELHQPPSSVHSSGRCPASSWKCLIRTIDAGYQDDTPLVHSFTSGQQCLSYHAIP